MHRGNSTDKESKTLKSGGSPNTEDSLSFRDCWYDTVGLLLAF